MNERPTGVTIISLLIIVGGALGIIGGLLAVLGSDDSALAGVGIGTLIVAVAQLVVGIGLWTLQKWAWTLAILVLGIRIVVDLVAVFLGGNLLTVIVSLVINGVLLWYLFRPNVQRAFGR